MMGVLATPTEGAVPAPEVWLKARQTHLIKEKEFTRLRDELSRERRDLTWVRVDQRYIFDGPEARRRFRISS